MTREEREYRERVIQDDLRSIENRIRHAFNQGYDLGRRLEQEPKVGHWINDKTIYNWRCSECGNLPCTLGYVGDRHFMQAHFKYCNHCGARMSEVSE